MITITLLAGWLLAIIAGPSASSGQDERYRLLVIPMKSGALDKKFGEKVAKEISERLDSFPTHRPVPERELKSALKQYEVTVQDLDAEDARMLANLMGAQVVYIATLTPSNGAYEVEADFVDVGTGDAVPVPLVTVKDKSDESVDRVAEAAIEAFEREVRFVRARSFCAEYIDGGELQNALRRCNEALEINPSDVAALYNKGLALYQIYEEAGGAWADSALPYFAGILELQPDHEEAREWVDYLTPPIYPEITWQLEPGQLEVWSPEKVESQIREHCRTEWPRYYGRRWSCYKQSAGSANEIAAWQQSHPGVASEAATKIFRHCLMEWSPWPQGEGVQDAYDYRMVEQCLEEEALALHPENVKLRLAVARLLAQLDRREEAINTIQRGLDYTPDDVALLESLGDYALRHSEVDSSYVDIALEAYEVVLALRGEETELRIIENAFATHIQTGRTDEAIAFTERALESHFDSPRLWSIYADVLRRVERLSEEISAMDRVLEIDSTYANGYLKRGQFKLQNGDQAGGIADFDLAMETGTSSLEDIYKAFYSLAHTVRDDGDLSGAVEHFNQAQQYVPADQLKELHFWWGYTEYQIGEQLARPESATLAELEQAREHFEVAQSHLEQTGFVHEKVPALRKATQQWLRNVEARIRRHRR